MSSNKKTIGVFVGSLRKGSYSKAIANVMRSLAPEDFELKLIELGELPIYNQDYDDGGAVPASYKSFRAEVKTLDGLLFITPEYNRSVPAVLKNALDVGSRPYGQSVWDGKPGAVISVSPGGLSAFGANHHLRQSLVFLNVPAMQQPEAYLGNVSALLDENGTLINDKTKAFLQQYMDAFVKWVKLFPQQH